MVRDALDFGSQKVQYTKSSIGVTFNFNTVTKAGQEVRKLRPITKAIMEEVRNMTGVAIRTPVYFHDETHYFVMAADKTDLLAAQIIMEPRENNESLTKHDNVDTMKVCAFARQVASLVGLPEDVDITLGEYGPDVGVFDFTAKRECFEGTKVLQAAHGQRLLVSLVGDAAQAPFWPLGTGSNKAVLGSFDAVHAMKVFTEKGLGSSDPADVHTFLQSQWEVFQARKTLLNAASSFLHQNVMEKQKWIGSIGTSEKFYAWSLDPLTRYKSIPYSPGADHGTRLLELKDNSMTASSPRKSRGRAMTETVVVEEVSCEMANMVREVMEDDMPSTPSPRSHSTRRKAQSPGTPPSSQPPGLSRTRKQLCRRPPSKSRFQHSSLPTATLPSSTTLPARSSSPATQNKDVAKEEVVAVALPKAIAEWFAANPHVQTMEDLRQQMDQWI